MYRLATMHNVTERRTDGHTDSMTPKADHCVLYDRLKSSH